MLLIKIGGSLIAPKKTDIFHSKRLTKVSSLIESFPFKQKIVLHGTGHFGHGAVKKYGVNEQGFMKIQTILLKYFEKIDEFFSGYVRISGKGIFQNECDMSVFDDEKKIIIGGSLTHTIPISSEKIFRIIQEKYQPPISYMITDVPGVFDKKGEIIPIINKENIKDLHFYKKEGDASGGMQEKIEQIQEAGKQYSGKTRIIDGNNLENLKDIIINDKGIGTQVYF